MGETNQYGPFYKTAQNLTSRSSYAFSNSRIRMAAFILIKSIELLGKNSNDERTSMYRYIGVINLH